MNPCMGKSYAYVINHLLLAWAPMQQNGRAGTKSSQEPIILQQRPHNFVYNLEIIMKPNMSQKEKPNWTLGSSSIICNHICLFPFWRAAKF